MFAASTRIRQCVAAREMLSRVLAARPLWRRSASPSVASVWSLAVERFGPEATIGGDGRDLPAMTSAMFFNPKRRATDQAHAPG